MLVRFIFKKRIIPLFAISGDHNDDSVTVRCEMRRPGVWLRTIFHNIMSVLRRRTTTLHYLNIKKHCQCLLSLASILFSQNIPTVKLFWQKSVDKNIALSLSPSYWPSPSLHLDLNNNNNKFVSRFRVYHADFHPKETKYTSRDFRFRGKKYQH